MLTNISVGYIRVSSKDQNESRQIEALKQIGIDERYIFIDKESGKNFDCPQYKAMISLLREGDTLYIKEIDRFGRNYDEILEQWRYITKTIKADIVVLDMPLLDTRKNKDLLGEFISDLVLQILSYVAENERAHIRERQREGIELAKARGLYKGRKPKAVDVKLFEKLYGEVNRKERTANYAMKQIGVKRTTWYKLAYEYKTKTGRFKVNNDIQ